MYSLFVSSQGRYIINNKRNPKSTSGVLLGKHENYNLLEEFRKNLQLKIPYVSLYNIISDNNNEKWKIFDFNQSKATPYSGKPIQIQCNIDESFNANVGIINENMLSTGHFSDLKMKQVNKQILLSENIGDHVESINDTVQINESNLEEDKDVPDTSQNYIDFSAQDITCFDENDKQNLQSFDNDTQALCFVENKINSLTCFANNAVEVKPTNNVKVINVENVNLVRAKIGHKWMIQSSMSKNNDNTFAHECSIGIPDDDNDLKLTNEERSFFKKIECDLYESNDELSDENGDDCGQAAEIENAENSLHMVIFTDNESEDIQSPQIILDDCSIDNSTNAFNLSNIDWQNLDSGNLNISIFSNISNLTAVSLDEFHTSVHNDKNDPDFVLTSDVCCGNNINNSNTEKTSMIITDENDDSKIILPVTLPSNAPNPEEMFIRDTDSQKEHFCLFCRKLVKRYGRHLETHKDNKEVADILALPKKSKERSDKIGKLRRQHDGEYNINPELNDGELLVLRRPNKTSKISNIKPTKMPSHYTICPDCKGYVLFCNVRHHHKQCINRKKEDKNENFKSHGTIIPISRMLTGRIHEFASELVKSEIIPFLRDDQISAIIRYDELLILYANDLAEKFPSEEDHAMIRQKLRRIGRFLIAGKQIAQEKGKTIIQKILNKELEDIMLDRLYKKIVGEEIIKSGNENDENKKIEDEFFYKVVRHITQSESNIVIPCIKNFASLFLPKNFDTCVAAVYRVVGYNEKKRSFASPTTAQAIGTALKAVGEFLITIYIAREDKVRKEQTKDFLKLANKKFEIINRIASETLNARKRTKRMKLSTENDIDMFTQFLESKRSVAYDSLQKKFSHSAWLQLCETTLLLMQIFNRRRQGEVSKSKIEEFHGYVAYDEKTYSDAYKKLSDKLKTIAHTYVRFTCRGKLGRTVSILLRPEILESIEAIIDFRAAAGVSSQNPYIFGLPCLQDKRNRRLIACDQMRKYARLSGVKDSNLLRGTNLRKHLATLLADHNLSAADLSDLAHFMGHEEKIHKNHYRDRTQREILTVTQFLENGKNPSGNTDLDEVSESDLIINNSFVENENDDDAPFNNSPENDSNDDLSEDEVKNENQTTYAKKRKNIEKIVSSKQAKQPKIVKNDTQIDEDDDKSQCSKKQVERIPWTDQEMNLVKTTFQEYMKVKKFPGKDEIENLIKKYSTVLGQRHYKHIKAWMSYQYRKERK